MTTVEPADELGLATSIGASFQVTIQHADSKAGMIAVMLSGIATVLLSQQDEMVAALAGNGPATRWLTAVLVVTGLALVVTCLGVAGAVWPRLAPPAAGNHFSFPAVAAAPAVGLGGATTEDLCAQAWSLNQRLAAIATAKHRQVSIAIAGMTVVALAAVPLLILLNVTD
jgi:hypothetical protein